MVWRGQPGRYEVWYLTLTHQATGDGFWIRYTLEAPGGHGAGAHGPPYAALWFARGSRRPEGGGTFGVHRRFPIADLRAGTGPFQLHLGSAEFADDRQAQGRLRGALVGAGHDVSWDLTFRPNSGVHRHMPDFAYLGGGRLVDTVVQAPNLSVLLSGVIQVDGQTYTCQDEPGGQSHLWGKKHAYSWAWAHCNAFEDGPEHERAVFEALTAQVRRGPVALPRLTMLTVYPDGLSGEELAFRGALQLLRNRSAYDPLSYHLVAEDDRARVEGTLSARHEDLVLTEYEDPDGEPAYCHNTVVGGCEVLIQRRRHQFPVVGAALSGWQDWRRLRTAGRAHWEWGARAGDSRVKQRHVELT